ncbi:hypothetical protein Tco_1321163 [Tanacetum coccineum]
MSCSSRVQYDREREANDGSVAQYIDSELQSAITRRQEVISDLLHQNHKNRFSLTKTWRFAKGLTQTHDGTTFPPETARTRKSLKYYSCPCNAMETLKKKDDEPDKTTAQGLKLRNWSSENVEFEGKGSNDWMPLSFALELMDKKIHTWLNVRLTIKRNSDDKLPGTTKSATKQETKTLEELCQQEMETGYHTRMAKPLRSNVNYHHDGPCAPKWPQGVTDLVILGRGLQKVPQMSIQLGLIRGLDLNVVLRAFQEDCPKLKNNNTQGNSGWKCIVSVQSVIRGHAGATRQQCRLGTITTKAFIDDQFPHPMAATVQICPEKDRDFRMRTIPQEKTKQTV